MDEIHGIMERAVEQGLARGQAEPLPQLGVDEKAFRKGHKYFTLVNDLERSRVLYVAEDRTQASLDGFWPTLTQQQRESIEAVAMDIWSDSNRTQTPCQTRATKRHGSYRHARSRSTICHSS